MSKKVLGELEGLIHKLKQRVVKEAGKDGLGAYSESLGYHRTYARKAIASGSVTMLRNLLKGGRDNDPKNNR